MNTATSQSREANDSFQDALADVRRLMQASDFKAAETALQQILDRAPDLVDALYMRAVCQRYLSQNVQARASISRALEIAPEFARAHQESGHLYKAVGLPDLALAAYQKACFLNPMLDASWQSLGELLHNTGAHRGAAEARRQAEYIRSLPTLLRAVKNNFHEGRALKAEQLCRAFLRDHPHHPEGMRALAEIAQKFGNLEEAEFLLESVTVLYPDHVQARIEHIEILRERQRYELAHAQSAALLALDPESPIFISHHAINEMHMGHFEKALALFEQVLSKVPNDPATLTSRGHVLKTFGRQDEAVASYKKAFQAKVEHGEAYYALANLKTYQFSDDEVRLMMDEEAKPDLMPLSRIHMCFALGKAFEDQKDIAEAMHYYTRGNQLKREASRYDADRMTDELEAQMKVFTPALLEHHKGAGCPTPDPIFIVGLPRAGSTLLEQILASHSQVDGTLELPYILSTAHRLRNTLKQDGLSYPASLISLADENLLELGKRYLADSQIHRQDAPFFTDKMPNNFRHIGLIHLMLPNAKIIDARRDPLDCCFSGFKQLFAQGQEFSYGLREIGQYYRDYVRLMTHWDEVLPGRVLRVQHEDVLEDLEGQVRRILDYLELPFEDNCIRFHETKRAVRTASSEQVRQPLNRAGVGRWRPFAQHLQPLIEALGADLVDPDAYEFIMDTPQERAL